MSKRVLLIDYDSKIPNLALMKLSAYHKAKGDEVGFNVTDPDIVYVSVIFSKNKQQAMGLKYMFPESEVIFGGSAINYDWLPQEIEFMKPDYDLYPSEYSQGFTTRGCIRSCPFCIVPKKEGYLKRWQHPKEFHDSRFDTIMIMDNNWLADKEWFLKTTDWIVSEDLWVIEHGMDIRLLDDEIAQRLAEMKFKKPIKFAFDWMWVEPFVRRGIEILKRAGINVRSNVMFYVLVGYNTTPEEDKYRCRLLKELGTNAFVMPYVKNEWTKKIARWANRKWLYWSIDIDEYNPKNDNSK